MRACRHTDIQLTNRNKQIKAETLKYHNFSTMKFKDTDVRNVPDKDFLKIIFCVFVCKGEGRLGPHASACVRNQSNTFMSHFPLSTSKEDFFCFCCFTKCSSKQTHECLVDYLVSASHCATEVLGPQVLATKSDFLHGIKVRLSELHNSYFFSAESSSLLS